MLHSDRLQPFPPIWVKVIGSGKHSSKNYNLENLYSTGPFWINLLAYVREGEMKGEKERVRETKADDRYMAQVAR